MESSSGMSYIYANGEWWVSRLYAGRIQVHLGEQPSDFNKYWDSAWGGDALAICQRWDRIPQSVKKEIVKACQEERKERARQATHLWKWRYFGYPSCAYTWMAILAVVLGGIWLLT